MSKVYIAAPWRDKTKMPEIARQVEAAGHTITHKWWLVEDVPEDTRSMEDSKEQALDDVYGVMSADLMILINSAKSEGKSLEQGVAIADGKDIIAVGKLGEFSKNVFHYLENYHWVDTLQEGLEWLALEISNV